MKTVLILVLTAFAVSQTVLVYQYEAITDRLDAELSKCAGIK